MSYESRQIDFYESLLGEIRASLYKKDYSAVRAKSRFLERFLENQFDMDPTLREDELTVVRRYGIIATQNLPFDIVKDYVGL